MWEERGEAEGGGHGNNTKKKKKKEKKKDIRNENKRVTYTAAWLADRRTSLPQSAGADVLVTGRRWKGCGLKERAKERRLCMMEKCCLWACCHCHCLDRGWRVRAVRRVRRGRAAVVVVARASIVCVCFIFLLFLLVW